MATTTTVALPQPASADSPLPQTGDIYPQVEKEVDTIILDLIEEQNLPGISLSIAKNDRLVASAGYGYANIDAGIPLHSEHQINIGSTTKATIAGPSAMLALEQAGLDPATTFLYGKNGLFGDRFDDAIAIGAELQDKPISWYYDITVQDLFDHTSGFDKADPDVTIDEFFPDVDELTYFNHHSYFLQTSPLRWAPGGYNYENQNFGLLELVIRAATGQDAFDFAREQLLEPYDLSPEIELKTAPFDANAAGNHAFDGDGEFELIDVDYSESAGLMAGGYRASSRDMVELMTYLADEYTPNELDRLGFEEAGLTPGLDWGDPSAPAGGSSVAYVSHGGTHEGGTSYVIMTVDGFVANIQTNIRTDRTPLTVAVKEILEVLRDDGLLLYYDLWQECDNGGIAGGLHPGGAEPEATLCDAPIAIAPDPEPDSSPGSALISTPEPDATQILDVDSDQGRRITLTRRRP
jgi:CubicO group peptidase (beta-lactamase class C family)